MPPPAMPYSELLPGSLFTLPLVVEMDPYYRRGQFLKLSEQRAVQVATSRITELPAAGLVMFQGFAPMDRDLMMSRSRRVRYERALLSVLASTAGSVDRAVLFRLAQPSLPSWLRDRVLGVSLDRLMAATFVQIEGNEAPRYALTGRGRLRAFAHGIGTG